MKEISQENNAKKITLISAHNKMFKNYANFNGRTRRKEYWLAVAAYAIIYFALFIIICIPLTTYMVNGELSVLSTIVMCISGIAMLVYALASLIPMLALSVRRLHDIGKSGWFLLLGCIPYIGSIIIFIFALLDSEPSVNKYGPNPKGIYISPRY